MRTHISVIAWLHIVLGALYVLGGALTGFLFLGMGGILGAAQGGKEGLAFAALFGGIGTFVFILVAVLGLPGILVGWGMLNYAPWARIGGIILSILNLISFPFGTALGIYGLIILFNQEAVDLFNRPNYSMR